MPKAIAVLAVTLSLVVSTKSFGQSAYATVSGTVDDGTGALVPGVSITARNNATGVATTVVTNESGTYNIPSLLPGVYKVSAELPGFQTQSFTDVQLGNAQVVRLNFSLRVAAVNAAVEVSVAADTLLTTSSPSIGQVLSQQRVEDLPTVGNNVLDLLRVLPGTRMNDDGVNGTFAGLGAYYVNLQRDGVESNAMARWGVSIQTSTYMSPDLVGEMRLVLAPVDAEMGRGNGQMLVLTRSGTNQFRGSAVWSIRNTALDANTWNNNNDIDSTTGKWKPTPADWINRNQLTVSFGGPIIKNKTFFFALFDGMLINSRTTQNTMVLTPCARRGIFRYFDNWNNGNALQVTELGTTPGTLPTIASVDALGQPLTPTINTDGSSPYTGGFRYASVFGQLAGAPTQADCSDAQLASNSTPWDANRRALDSTGFITAFLGTMPPANNYEIGDGLNTAGHRWLRSVHGGTESIFGTGGVGTGTDGLGRRQINFKIDHQFNQDHKLAATYTYERSAGEANLMSFPDTFRGSVFRRPQHLSFNFTSTLSPSLLNEARVGMRRTGGNTYSPMTDPEFSGAAQAFYPNIGGYPLYIGPGLNQVNFQGVGPLGGNGSTQTYNDVTAMWTYGDTLSWSKGKHAYKFGGEARFGHSLGYDAGINPTSIPRATGGDAMNAPIALNAINSTNVPGLAGPTSGLNGNNIRMRNLMSFLAGSVASVNQFYYIQSPTKLDAFESYLTYPQRVRDFHSNEFSLFFKDDWKFRKNLTLNLGLRYDYYGVPYESSGLMPLPIGGGSAIFGLSGNSFDDWMKPGVRGDLTNFEFVGKHSTNPDKPWYPNDWNNFGPAVGFAWQVPWFGEGKTTVRGGYQITYQIGEPFNAMTQETIVPGNTYQATYTGDNGANAYLDLTKLSSIVPVPVLLRPQEPVPVTARNQSLYNPDPNLVTPYVQNITMSVTRSIRPNLTVDFRYLGVLVRKLRNYTDLNAPNFLYNGLKEALDAARAGDDSNPSLQILEDVFRGINIAGSGFGAVGQPFNGVQQTAGMHLRASAATTGVGANLSSALANGDYARVAAILNTMNYSKAVVGGVQLNPGLPNIPSGVFGEVLRFNGAVPENFIATNPQFGAVNYITNQLSNNYHSFEAQVTLRPTQGVSLQGTYTWSKNLGAGNAALGPVFTNPADRSPDYTLKPDTRIHDFRVNGSFVLPMGPNRMFFTNSTGVLARAVENWQFSWIANMNTGQPLSISAQNMLYAFGVPDVVGPFDTSKREVEFRGGPSGNYLPVGAYSRVQDEQCLGVTTQQNLRNLCTLTAIRDATTGQVLLRNPSPGSRGTLGQRVIEGPGIWRLDASLSKEFRITESKSLQIRMDARNVLNHPEPATPNLDINSGNFGLITGNNAKSTLHREFQGQVRLNF
jgi:hypothetical protein